MRRFMVFAFDAYFPNGGIRDLFSTADTLEEAITQLRTSTMKHGQVYDVKTQKFQVWTRCPNKGWQFIECLLWNN
jgi:hypothetical protein